MASRLTEKELQICRELFSRFDTDNNGTIDVLEIKSALTAMGQQTSEEDLFLILSEADADNSGVIEFDEFVKTIARQKTELEKSRNENATIDAFVALGGNPDRSGKISLDKLRATLEEFDLMRNVEVYDQDGSGFIEYDEFKKIVDES